VIHISDHEAQVLRRLAWLELSCFGAATRHCYEAVAEENLNAARLVMTRMQLNEWTGAMLAASDIASQVNEVQPT
jgi:hypothetical protein